MAKGYWIAHIEVEDAERYKDYVAAATPVYKEYGANPIIRGGDAEQTEGDALGSRHVVIEFDSLEKAKACYNSPGYQEARKHRQGASTGRVVIVEGAE